MALTLIKIFPFYRKCDNVNLLFQQPQIFKVVEFMPEWCFNYVDYQNLVSLTANCSNQWELCLCAKSNLHFLYRNSSRKSTNSITEIFVMKFYTYNIHLFVRVMLLFIIKTNILYNFNNAKNMCWVLKVECTLRHALLFFFWAICNSKLV